MNAAPKLFRVTIEVGDFAKGSAFYVELFGIPGTQHRGGRHYFDCGGTIVSVLDVSASGAPTPGPKSLYFAVADVEAVHQRARALGALATYSVHGAPAGDVTKRPWGERSFYVVDPWGNDLCFVDEKTLFT